MRLDDRSTIRREDEWQDDTIIGTFYTFTYIAYVDWAPSQNLGKQAYAYGLGAKTRSRCVAIIPWLSCLLHRSIVLQ